MADTPQTPEVEDLIRYDVLAQEALLGVVKKVLSEVAHIGSLPGEHHFFITFDTCAPGVKISPRMKEKYPEEMTIVVQHQFWDLKTTETGFSIGLSFNEIAETLGVPYASIRGFFDPAVQFGLQFDGGDSSSEAKELENISAEISKLSSVDENKVEAEKPDDAAESDKSEDAAGSADVVSLDAFRKK